MLGPCPACSGQVPLAEIRHLADLGTYLARPPHTPEDLPSTTALPDTFTSDQGHASTCHYGEIF
ncbi:hypothetical protein ACQ4WX_35255 [Streptomyces lasalocidi]